MAANVKLNAATADGGDSARSIDRGSGVKTQVVTLDMGGAGAEALLSGVMPVIEAAPTTVASAKVTVTTAGVRVQFATTTCKSITVKAAAANAGIIYVDGSGVSAANGFPLSAGDTISLDISNTNIIWVDSSVSGDICNWISVN